MPRNYANDLYTFRISGGGAQALTLTVTNGTLTLSGQTVTLKVDRKLSVVYNTLTLTGKDLTLKADRKLSVTYNSLTLSGQSITLTKSEEAFTGTILVYDEILLREPRLALPGKKPLGKIKLREQSKFVTNATNILLFNGQTPGDYNAPYDIKTKKVWTAYNTSWAPYVNTIREDTPVFKYGASDYSCCYESQIIDNTNADTTKQCLVMSFALDTDDDGYILAMDTSSSCTSTSIIFGSGFDANEVRVYVNDAHAFVDIPWPRERINTLVWHYNGASTHSIWTTTSPNSIRTYSGAFGDEDANNRLYLAPYRYYQATTTFNLLYFSYGWAPSIQELISFARNPWPELVRPT